MGEPRAGTTTVVEKGRVALTSTEERHALLRRLLLTCGIVGAALYPFADIVAAARYPGFSYRDQAVSELFAIGAPTSELVVTLFSLSSTLLVLFAIGIWMSANDRRSVRWLAAMMGLNALDALVLWNYFPMHMRGSEPTFTDLMHGLLAIDPFLLTAVVLGAVAFPGPFRTYTVATLVFSGVLAVVGFSYVSAVVANEPTPWMGATERAAQYATNLWYTVLAVVLLRERKPAQTSAQPRSRLGTGRSSRFALACGLASALLYAAMLVVVPLAWSEYSSASQTVSELSAIDAPTRPLWVPLGIVWTLLYGAFGWGVWKAGSSSRALRIAGGSILLSAVVGISWPPMHLREVLAAGGGTLTDTLHIVWTAANAVFTLVAMGFAAAALGRGFRIYSMASIVVLIAAGAVTSMSAPQLEAGLPTPWMGAWERVNIAAWLLWVAVLSVVLLWRAGRESPAPPRRDDVGSRAAPATISAAATVKVGPGQRYRQRSSLPLAVSKLVELRTIGASSDAQETVSTVERRILRGKLHASCPRGPRSAGSSRHTRVPGPCRGSGEVPPLAPARRGGRAR
jgi:hypothetical protein